MCRSSLHTGMERPATQRSIDGLKWEDSVVAWYTPKAQIGVINSRYDRNVRNLCMENSAKEQDLINQIREEERRMGNAVKKVKDIMERVEELEQVKRDLESERREKERRKAEAKRIEHLVRALERQENQAQERAATMTRIV
ncbi:hypothetical protein FGB62_329g09 [Gracilaria domingensis]|nr:hypothetical protein FGB62_329g09 [Gracilaria domingensis]